MLMLYAEVLAVCCEHYILWQSAQIWNVNLKLHEATTGLLSD